MSELIRGGQFLTRPLGDKVATPEHFSQEQHEFKRTTAGFVKKQVVPHIARIEAKDLDFLRQLIAQAGELGLLAVDVPEEYEGLGLDKTTSMIMAETMQGCGSWAVTYGAQVGIGMLPIVFFGDDQQKKKYLPKLSSGQWVGAYALTEAGAGSDALGIRCKAVADGDDYILNGTKQWITNAGMADVFIVFAKIDGSKFTGFIVERTDPGVTIGPEEHKLGLRGSSTCEVILEDARIPKDRVLGRVGRGARIAFGILFMGRLKLGIAAIGGAKEVLTQAIGYAAERKQFDRPILEFGLVRHKLAHMALRLYACESMGYRTAGLIDTFVDTPQKRAKTKEDRIQMALEEYGIESAILKVYGSEMLDFVVDEALQIHGGYGYTEHYDIERIYRDSRINRIFEGSNEINRLLISGTALRRAKKKQLSLNELAQQVEAELADPSKLPTFADSETLGAQKQIVERLKHMGAYVATATVEANADGLEQRQDILGTLADLFVDIYAAESSLLRTLQMVESQGLDKTQNAVTMTQAIVEECCADGTAKAKLALGTVLEGEALSRHLQNVARLTDRPTLPWFRLLERITGRLEQDSRYSMPA